MANAADIARRKIAELRKEIADLEAFLEKYEALEKTVDISSPSAKVMSAVSELMNYVGNIAQQAPVDNRSVSVENSGRKGTISFHKQGKSSRPDEVAKNMERIIREVGRPMTRGDIVKAFEARDLKIPYEDKERYVGTIAWRQKGTFVNVPGQGYWLRDEPHPGAVSEFFSDDDAD